MKSFAALNMKIELKRMFPAIKHRSDFNTGGMLFMLLPMIGDRLSVIFNEQAGFMNKR